MYGKNGLDTFKKSLFVTEKNTDFKSENFSKGYCIVLLENIYDFLFR